MTQEEINKMFEGRWRFKGDTTLTIMHNAIDGKLSLQELSVKIASLCRDFFEAGILIAQEEAKQSLSFVDSAASTGTGNISFDAFWDLYDKKVGKPKCIKLWGKLTARECEECIRYIPLYKQAQPDKQYRKNPETFLRNKSWNDELIFRNNGTQQPTIQQQRIDKLAEILTD